MTLAEMKSPHIKFVREPTDLAIKQKFIEHPWDVCPNLRSRVFQAGLAKSECVVRDLERFDVFHYIRQTDRETAIHVYRVGRKRGLLARLFSRKTPDIETIQKSVQRRKGGDTASGKVAMIFQTIILCTTAIVSSKVLISLHEVQESIATSRNPSAA